MSPAGVALALDGTRSAEAEPDPDCSLALEWRGAVYTPTLLNDAPGARLGRARDPCRSEEIDVHRSPGAPPGVVLTDRAGQRHAAEGYPWTDRRHHLHAAWRASRARSRAGAGRGWSGCAER